jgi:predicted DNA-binding transcriptional regulator AlpA
MASPRTRLLDLAEVCAATKLGKSAIYTAAKAGTFPSPRKALGRSVWLESEIDDWLRSLVPVYADDNDLPLWPIIEAPPKRGKR